MLLLYRKRCPCRPLQVGLLYLYPLHVDPLSAVGNFAAPASTNLSGITFSDMALADLLTAMRTTTKPVRNKLQRCGVGGSVDIQHFSNGHSGSLQQYAPCPFRQAVRGLLNGNRSTGEPPESRKLAAAIRICISLWYCSICLDVEKVWDVTSDYPQ